MQTHSPKETSTAKEAEVLRCAGVLQGGAAAKGALPQHDALLQVSVALPKRPQIHLQHTHVHASHLMPASTCRLLDKPAVLGVRSDMQGNLHL